MEKKEMDNNGKKGKYTIMKKRKYTIIQKKGSRQKGK